MPDLLVFQGIVARGAEKFGEELVVPGSADLPVAIEDWPENLEPGTLNVKIKDYPPSFLEAFGSNADVKHLDTRRFEPEVELPYDAIENNTLPPTPDFPDKGRAQIWRAKLGSGGNSEGQLCWVLRRIGSGYANVLECVAGVHLRTTLGVENGDVVSLAMEGTWT